MEGYQIEANDGNWGHVETVIADTTSWEIPYLALDTKNGWPGRKVLIPVGLKLRGIDPTEQIIHLDLDQERIKLTPAYDPYKAIARDYEDQLFEYYGLSAIEG